MSVFSHAIRMFPGQATQNWLSDWFRGRVNNATMKLILSADTPMQVSLVFGTTPGATGKCEIGISFFDESDEFLPHLKVLTMSDWGSSEDLPGDELLVAIAHDEPTLWAQVNCDLSDAIEENERQRSEVEHLDEVA